MLNRSSFRRTPPRGVVPKVSAQRRGLKPCTQQSACSCFSGPRKPIPLGLNLSPSLPSSSSARGLLHMDECTDPDCMDLEQLKALQKSLDRFTDYEHYERCCDSDHPAHHHHHLVRHGDQLFEQCCDEPGDKEACIGESIDRRSDSCDDCEAECDECVEDHSDCFEQIDVCEEDCDQCEEECEERGHDREDCPQNHPTTRDNCVASCDIPLPLLGPTSDFDIGPFSVELLQQPTPCTDDCSAPIIQTGALHDTLSDHPFNTALDHWQTFVQSHHCAPDPCLLGQLPPYPPPQHVEPNYGFNFGSDPMIVGNQYSWQKPQAHCAIPITPISQPIPTATFLELGQPSASMEVSTPSASSQMSMSSPVPATPSSNGPDRTCQWVMPCGSICGANFARTEDLKKHVKNSHGTKGVLTCGWRGCSASFATEAALTGHTSKKHLAFDEEGPWKCTFPNCSKSFMYKQVRDEHVSSHTGGNRMHCPICHQWLNAEGSNFRRHMASHGPKHEHMKCKFEHLGCKRRFPRVDNLRRHEACCKFGKRAQGVHHHHHRIHHHQL